jgi:putative sigma-54 modulation protein
MNLEIQTRNLRLSDRIQDYAEKKLNRLDRYLPKITAVRLDLAHEHSKTRGEFPTAQLTVRSERGTLLRAEVKDQNDMFAAIDVVVDKMYRQIERYKGKRRNRTGTDFDAVEPELAAAEPSPIDLPEADEDEQDLIIRRKEIELVPMSEQEAIDQLEMLGHNFFVFYNADTATVNVVYKRQNSGYGLIQPTVG